MTSFFILRMADKIEIVLIGCLVKLIKKGCVLVFKSRV